MSVLLLAGPALHLTILAVLAIASLAAFGGYRLARGRRSARPKR